MNHSTTIQTLSLSLICRTLTGAILLIVLAANASAQSNTQGSTPAGMAPGAPAGSYALSDFENVNLYNGNLNFSLPLVKIGGRGGGGHAITLNLDHKWSVYRDAEPGIPAKYYPTPAWIPDVEMGDVPPYNIGKLTIRQGGTKNFEMKCGDYYYQKTLTRLTFAAPGGTEYELRDVATSGQPVTPPCGVGFNRGKIFVTSDGSAATFISDSDIFDAWGFGGATNYPPSGYMMMNDGTRYRIEDGEIRWERDRNGNQMTFAYTSVNHWLASVTDQLNRQVTITYGTPPAAPYDDITFKGFGGATRTIRVNYTLLQNALRSGFTIQTDHALFPELNGYYNLNVNPKVTSSITLPDGRQYQFFYNSYAELSRVVLPTGAAIEYDYAAGLTNGASSGVINFVNDKHVYRRVIERRVYPDGGSGSTYETRMTYSRPETTTSNLGYVVTDNFGPGSVLLGRQWHYFHGSPRASFGLQATEYSAWQDGREYWTYVMAADGATVLRQIVQTFAQREAISWWIGDSNLAPPNDVRLVQTETTLMDSNQVTRQTFSYDQFNNLTDTYDYDYGSGSAGAFIRRAHTDYMTINPANQTDYSSGTAFNSIHVRNLPTEQWVSSDSAGNNMVSRTTYEYDNYASDTYHYPLTDRQNISGLCTSFTSAGVCSNSNPGPTTYVTRGNVTAVSRWLFSNNTPITTYAQYDIAGNEIKAIDARGYSTDMSYADNFGAPDGDVHTNSQPTDLGSLNSYAFVTSASNALQQTVYTQYDYYLGNAVDVKDVNGVISSSFYEDNLDRPTQVILANNITALRQREGFTYDDSYRTITVTSDLRSFNDNLLKRQTIYDGLGRTIETRNFENSTDYIASRQVPFDVQQDTQTGTWRTALKVSNPFRPGLGEQPTWTTTLNDPLGRPTNVNTPDNAILKTTYVGNETTVEDQAGKQRKSVTDAIGRLTAVYEAPNDTTNYNLQTSYTYDALGTLRMVSEGSQKRYFYYDSLSRLIRTRNPEIDINTSLNLASDALTENNSQWSLAFSYDPNGNLLTRTDARGTVTAYTYDALNRLTTRGYSGGTAVATPTATYTYDATGVAYSKGRLTSVSSNVSTYNYTGYDALGRITGSQQITDGQPYSMNYTYDLSGNMTSQTYPTGRVVTQNFDGAGRLASINGLSSGGTPKTYVNSIGYSAHGAAERMRLGNGRWEHTNFNQRLQPIEIGVGTSATESSILKLNYDYGTSNNGNLLRQVITVPTIGTATGFTATQNYQYDELNRLTGAQEINGTSSGWQSSGTLWQQIVTYDRYGNRAIDTTNTTSAMIGPNPVVSSSTNRITPRTSPVEYYEYDAGGNMKKGQGGEVFTYDGENRLAQYNGGASQAGGVDYAYDGDGRRVKKAKLSENTTFVYNIGEQLVAEYTSSTTESNGTSYLTSDTLNTPRVVTKADGSIRARHDYLPFGEELYAGAGNRNTAQGFGEGSTPLDKTRQKFTSKERDTETGLDYFGARYYANSSGRFTTSDPYLPSAEAIDPQTWNRYTYVLNNPLKYVDAHGLAYANLSEEQRRLFSTYAAKHNNGGKLTDEQVYATLDESQMATFESITNALEKTQLTDKKTGKSLGNALSLVGSLDEIVGENIGGKNHLRLYVNLTSEGVGTLEHAKQFGGGIFNAMAADHKRYGKDGKVITEFPDNLREDGGLPSLQISYAKDRIQADIDIDYRGLGEGHTKHYNSDVRQTGPEIDSKGRPINNYLRYIDRWSGLQQWWKQEKRADDYYNGKSKK